MSTDDLKDVIDAAIRVLDTGDEMAKRLRVLDETRFHDLRAVLGLGQQWRADSAALLAALDAALEVTP